MTIFRKITNKERCGYRGKKQRYSVWRAEQNSAWEKLNKAMVETLCEDNKLNLNDFLSKEERNTWEHTYDNIRNAGYGHVTKSIREHMNENSDLFVDYKG
jgi:hypothetical protein